MRSAIGSCSKWPASQQDVFDKPALLPKQGLIALFICSALVTTSARSESVGLGGGGAIYSPVISPSPTNSSLMFVSCDMSGLYRSADRGLSWTLLDQRQVKGSTDFSVAFEPANTNHLVAFHPTQGLKESTVGGADGSWTKFVPELPANTIVTSAAFSDISNLAVATAPPAVSGTTLGVVYELVSNVWVPRPAPIQPPTNGTLRLKNVLWARDPSSGLRTTLIAANAFNSDGTLASSGVFTWRSSSSSWIPVGVPPLAAGEIVDFAAALTSTQYVLYAVLASGRVYRYASSATPAVWVDQSTVVSGLPFDAINKCGQFRYVTVSANEEVAYVAVAGIDGTATCKRALYKRAANGTWAESLFGFQNGSGTTLTNPGWIEQFEPAQGGLGWGFGGAAHGIAVAPHDPAKAVFVNNAAAYTTADGGATWGEAYSSGSLMTRLWKTTGLDVTSSWNYFVNGTTHFIANTDIGLSRSDDGVVWENITGTFDTQWLNVYDLAFEGSGVAQAGEQCAGQKRTWAAASKLHDIPDEKTLDDADSVNQAKNHGTVLISCNGGADWNATAMNPAAPLPDGPVVSLLYRLENGTVKTLYASVWRKGVYRSAGTTIGYSWTPVGSIAGTNQHVYQLRENAGSIYVTVTATKVRTGDPNNPFRYETGGFYRLAGSTWTNLTAGFNLGPVDFTFDPYGTAYLATIDTHEFATGGIWKVIGSSANYVTTLRPKIAAKSYHDPNQILAFAPSFINDSLYLTTNQGIWMSDRQTLDWTEVFTEIPFLRSQRLLRPTPGSPALYLTTFGGGVWKPKNFILSANPGAITVIQGRSGSSAITVTPSGSFNSSVALSALNLPTGASMSFSPNPVAAGASSTATFNPGTAGPGLSTVTVKGTSGSLERTTPLTCTIDRPPCRPDNCASGCCANDVCQAGTLNDACGTAGGACMSCASGTTCQGGSCVCTPTCTGLMCGQPDNCGGTCPSTDAPYAVYPEHMWCGVNYVDACGDNWGLGFECPAGSYCLEMGYEYWGCVPY